MTVTSPDTAPELNVAVAHEALAAALPDRPCIVFRDRRLSYAEVTARTRQLAHVLHDRGLGARPEGRAGLKGHQSHQDHLAIYAYNGNEYLEAMLGAYKARVAPVNVNYRYVAEELRYLLADSGARAIVFHSALAPTLAEVLADLPQLTVLLQIADDSGNDLLPGAEWYEEALAAASDERPAWADEWSPDDLYILYTGGTTGMPKGVLWRQSDIFRTAMGGRNQGTTQPWASIDELVEAATSRGMVVLPAAPFMHGAGHWIAFLATMGGSTVVIQDVVDRLDPKDICSTIEREKVNFLQLVGDAFGRPIAEEMETGNWDMASLFIVLSGGAALSTGLKERFLALLPNAMIIDGLGSSEGGGQGTQVTTAGGPVSTGTFLPGAGSCVVAPDLSAVLPPGHEGDGWLAKFGDVPLGYLGDPAKTERTFPVIGGVRHSVPGDRARHLADGTIELLGRDAVTVNSGGEKIFVEEVEAAVAGHPDVYDVVVCGRPSEAWGQEVVAIVQLRDGAATGTPELEASLRDEAARHIARYKLPKAWLFVDRVVRSPSGKADYRWAKQLAADS
jgi:acyl-CoA synthetase (AMP-forming)/AMP-acid ligase II